MDSFDAPLPSDAAALADLAAGRFVGSEAVACWLGGWHLARTEPRNTASHGLTAALIDDRDGEDRPDPLPWPSSHPSVGTPGDPAGTALVWTDAAIADCHRIRGLLAHCGAGAEHRLAALLVATMVELIVDGARRPDGAADLPLLPPLNLRIVVGDDRVAVLGLRWSGSVT